MLACFGYPYYFIDAGALGLPRALLNMAGLSLMFVAMAYALWTLAHLRQRMAR